MKKTITLSLIIAAVIFLCPSFTKHTYANTSNVISITLHPNTAQIDVTDINGETTTKFTEDISSFIDENGVAYFALDYIGDFIQEERVTYEFDEKTSTGIASMEIAMAPGGIFFKNHIEARVGYDRISMREGLFGPEIIYLDTVPVLKNGKLYMPLRETLSIFDFKGDKIVYNSEDKTITLHKNLYFEPDKKSSVFKGLIDDSYTQYVVDGDVYYYEYSQNYNAIEKYMKENINPDLDIDNFKITEDGSTSQTGHGLNSLSLKYVVGDLSSDFGYNLIVEDNRVVLFTQIGTDISKNPPVVDTSNMLSDEELCKMALADKNDSTVVAEQKVYRCVDSATGKIKYTVETVYGDDESGYCCLGFEYMP
ncbi:MAG: hypothetical protein AB7E42_02640 [Anaerotignaceae bacterium]